MADPLRRTLSKLRNRRSQRGVASPGEAVGHPNGGGVLRSKAQRNLQPQGNRTAALCAPLGSPAGGCEDLVSPLEESELRDSTDWCRQGKAAIPGERLPGASIACPCPQRNRVEGTRLPPPSPPGFRAPPPSELPLSSSVFPRSADSESAREQGDGSEEDDYYDNQSLPGWGCHGTAGALDEARGAREGSGAVVGGSSRARARESTGRLRSQLQEAYYLLIHAMHDLPPASPTVAGCSPHPVTYLPFSGDGERKDGLRWSPSCRNRSSPLQGSDPGSQGSARGPAWHRDVSKSLETLLFAQPPARPPSTRRCRSDSALRSLLQEPLAPQGHLLQKQAPPRPPPPSTRREACCLAVAAGCSGDSSCKQRAGSRSVCGVASSALPDDLGQMLLPKFGSALCTTLAEAAALGSSVGPEEACGGGEISPPSAADAHESLPKPPAVTVRKLQKWMYKGRLLSLGMRGRGAAAGTSPSSPAKAPGACGPLLGREEGSADPQPAPLGGHGGKGLVAPSDQRILLTDLIENVYIPSVSRRELKTFKSIEGAECRPRITSITVSKKRNWLHQSSPRVPNLEKGNSGKKKSGEGHQVLKTPSPLLEPKMTQTSSTLIGHESPKRRVRSVHAAVNGMNPLVMQKCTLDFGDDNDADDEGEIWYNPIPEDDDPDFPCFISSNVDHSDSQAMNFKVSSGSDVVKTIGDNEGLLHFTDSAGNAQLREFNQVNCVHFMEHSQVPQPKPGCSILTGSAVEDSSALKSALGAQGALAARWYSNRIDDDDDDDVYSSHTISNNNPLY
ncbi:Rho GTPase-activating protein SYDE2 [Varanus komodoensis]|nr:Rho GTPase-activating protein SYDE2 [Varanus komodoensis]